MSIAHTLLIVAFLGLLSDEAPSSIRVLPIATPQAVRDRNDPLPITPTAKPVTKPDGTKGFALQLTIAKGVQINSERPLEFGIPLQIRFLDSDFKPVPAKLVHPKDKAKRIKVDSLPDYFVYEREGDPSLVVYGYPARPATYITVFYQDFNTERMH